MPGPELRSGCVPVEAEEVFDSLVGHLAGRGQPANRPALRTGRTCTPAPPTRPARPRTGGRTLRTARICLDGRADPA